MNILVTGGAGYKGLKLGEALLERGHRVTVLDNFMYGYDAALFLFRYPQVSFVKKDIRNIDKADVAGHDVVFHLAGISGYPACEANPHSAQAINVGGTEKLLSCLDGRQLIVYASTTSIYGQAGTLCTEDTPIAPASLYGLTKYEAEKLCLQYSPSIAFRFATIYGVAPKMRWDLMPNDFVMRAVQERSLVLFDSRSVRTFLHVEDAIAAYLMALEQTDAMAGHVYNVGCEQGNLSKLQLAQEINRHVDFAIIDSTLPDLDARNFIINFDRISALGFVPKKTLAEGITDLIKLFRFFRPTQAYRVI
jgi:nucleoside-diphosphate-sugar epimerase